MIAIIVPALRRPGNVAPLLDSIERSTPEQHRVLFVCDPGDTAEQDAIAREGGWMVSPGGSYAAKVHAGVEATDEALIFVGADDLRFHPGWFPAARARMVDGVHVVGVNDRVRRRHRPLHATHFLMTREYAELPAIDGRPGPLCELYHHSFVDDELIATATHRRMYAYAPEAVVEHRHWMNLTAPDDDIYRLGRQHFQSDRAIFRARQHLWT